MLNFIYEWEAFWEGKELLSLMLAIIIIVMLSQVIKFVDWRRSKHI